MVVHRIAGITEVDWVMGSIYLGDSGVDRYTKKNDLT